VAGGRGDKLTVGGAALDRVQPLVGLYRGAAPVVPVAVRRVNRLALYVEDGADLRGTERWGVGLPC